MVKFSTSSRHPIILCQVVPVTPSLQYTPVDSKKHSSPPIINLASLVDSHAKETNDSHDVMVRLAHEYLVKGDDGDSPGLVMLFDMNPVAQQLLPHVRVVLRQRASLREPLLCHVKSRGDGSCVLNLGSITKRSVTGIPQAWEEMKLTI